MLCLEAAKTLEFLCSSTNVVFTADGFELSAGVETYKILGQNTATTGGTVKTLYTVPASTSAFVKKLIAVNTSTAATFQMFVVGHAAANAFTGVMALLAQGYAVYEDGLWKFYDAFGREQLKVTAI